MPDDIQSPAERRSERRWSWWLLCVVLLLLLIVGTVLWRVICGG